MEATSQTIGDAWDYQAYPLPGDPDPEPCRHCASTTIPVFGGWIDTNGLFRCPSGWTEHEPMLASAER